jgi:hypothetical protein
MRRKLLTGVLLAIPLLAGAADQNLDSRVAESRAATKAFMQQLKAALQQAMQEGGPVEAIGVCNERAPEIAQNVSATRGLDIGRTSLKVRNPDNAPDDWERSVLERFEARKAGGEPAVELEFHEVVSEDGAERFRYMKAIPTGGLCLVCHGENIAEPVQARLNELYPDDQATGFQEGDIRGAFTVSQPLAAE